MNNTTDLTILDNLIESISKGDLSVLDVQTVKYINDKTMEILGTKDLSPFQYQIGNKIVLLSNILYNNTDRAVLPLEDGVYDLLIVKTGSNIVGAPPTENVFDDTFSSKDKAEQLINPVSFMDREKVSDFLYYDEIGKHRSYQWVYPVRFEKEPTTRRTLDTAHNYPELVGTLDKCKFVLNNDARERGVFDDDNVAIFERDFIQKHIQMGILDPNRVITMVAELKYDGVSVEGDVTNMLIGARSRGDTANDVATDLTPILGGYYFPNVPGDIKEEDVFGMKFEAILTKSALVELSMRKGRQYKNCRNAMQGILGALDGYAYRDLVTLVPLATSLNLNRLEEIEFMNKFYNTGEPLRYAVLQGTYVEILFQVKRFLDEAEYLREFLPFMYDGIVVSYVDEDIIQALGREGSVNKYSMAIKFNPLVKQAQFLGYGYTVGQKGNITPMIHYTPVEFYGTIHSKSTGHSYQRFCELDLHIGDILNIEYTNDVMPYVTKADVEANRINATKTPPERFITSCPSCGQRLVMSKSGKSVQCININCPDRNLARMVNMLQKLNLKDFSDESLRAIGKTSLKEILDLKREDLIDVLGDVNSQKFIDRMNELRSKPIEDYKIIGAIGFTGLAQEKFRVIMQELSLDAIIKSDAETLYGLLTFIKGIGPQAATTICDEREFFMDDLLTIASMPNVIRTQGLTLGKSIRFSGVRDQELEALLVSRGYDASSVKGVTRATDILIVPDLNYKSGKTSKVGPDTKIVPIQEFKNNLEAYLSV